MVHYTLAADIAASDLQEMQPPSGSALLQLLMENGTGRRVAPGEMAVSLMSPSTIEARERWFFAFLQRMIACFCKYAKPR